jgi:hypothetical protein
MFGRINAAAATIAGFGMFFSGTGIALAQDATRQTWWGTQYTAAPEIDVSAGLLAVAAVAAALVLAWELRRRRV